MWLFTLWTTSSTYAQSLSEMDFERGIWQAALDGDVNRVRKLFPNLSPATAPAQSNCEIEVCSWFSQVSCSERNSRGKAGQIATCLPYATWLFLPTQLWSLMSEAKQILEWPFFLCRKVWETWVTYAVYNLPVVLIAFCKENHNSIFFLLKPKSLDLENK